MVMYAGSVVLMHSFLEVKNYIFCRHINTPLQIIWRFHSLWYQNIPTSSRHDQALREKPDSCNMQSNGMRISNNQENGVDFDHLLVIMHLSRIACVMMFAVQRYLLSDILYSKGSAAKWSTLHVSIQILVFFLLCWSHIWLWEIILTTTSRKLHRKKGEICQHGYERFCSWET